MFCLGSFVIVKTPTSLIERKQLTMGLATLKKIQGTDNIDAEYKEIMNTYMREGMICKPFKNLMKRSSRL